MSAPDDDTPSRRSDLLAAEHALGLLDGESLAAAERRCLDDPEFARAVEAWRLRLAPLAQSLPERAPPAHVKAALLAGLFGDTGREARNGPASWLNSLAFWRGAAGLASLLAVAAITMLVATSAPERAGGGRDDEGPGYFAALRDSDASPVVLVRYDAQAGQLLVSGPVRADAGQPVQPELWVIPASEGAAPQSLGLIADLSGTLERRLSVEAGLGDAIAEGATFAISLEPPGGSPTGAPTGPVVALGAVQSL